MAKFLSYFNKKISIIIPDRIEKKEFRLKESVVRIGIKKRISVSRNLISSIGA